MFFIFIFIFIFLQLPCLHCFPLHYIVALTAALLDGIFCYYNINHA